MGYKSNTIGLGFWNNSDSYSKVTGLPVISAIRIITSEVIMEKIKSKGSAKVLSIGIGSGALYKEFFKDDIESGLLELHGFDILEDMTNLCKKELGDKPYLKVGKAEDIATLFKESYDVIEAGLILHHVLRLENLENIIKTSHSLLNRDGYFVLGDIDVHCGEHIEDKLNSLESKVGKLDINLQNGHFYNSTYNSPIFDPTDENDKLTLDNLNKITCAPLLEEVMNLEPGLKDKLLPLIKQNIASANMSLEWHREVFSETGWYNLFKKYFKEIEVIDSTQIKERFIEVKDNPFVIICSPQYDPLNEEIQNA